MQEDDFLQTTNHGCHLQVVGTFFFFSFHEIKYLLQLMSVQIINIIQLKCRNTGNILNFCDALRGKNTV